MAHMSVVVAKPPLFDKINAKFNVDGKPVFFTFGDKIYNPMGANIPPAIMAHEKIHMLRQGVTIESWWERYIDDDKFRLEEELPAHAAEYRWWLEAPEGKQALKGFRSLADYHLIHIAKRLSSPLYGNLISFNDAKFEIAQLGKELKRMGSD